MSDELEKVEEYQDGMRFSQLDYQAAEYLMKSPLHPRPLEIISYHCQQAAEKVVKALIVYFGSQGGMPKVHDIGFLLNQIRNILKNEKDVEITEEIMDIADSLSKYGVAPRYPNEILIDEKQTAEAFRSATVILEWVQNIVDMNNEIGKDSQS